MNRQIRLVGLGIIVLFVALFVQLNYLQVVHAPALDANGLDTARADSEFNEPRGAIISSDGVTLAQSVRTPKGSEYKYERRYPTGSLFGQITGYYSFIYGDDGVEKTYNDILTGAKDKSGFPTSIAGLRQLLTQSSRAQDVTLTLSDKLQRLARAELAGHDGSIVALDPSTGAILAMYSNPSYNPNPLSQLSGSAEGAARKADLAAPGDPLLPGAYRNRWFPGSSFKIITASTVYDRDPSLATKPYPVLGALPLPDTTNELHNFGGGRRGGQLLELFTVSCDSGFGAVGLDLGAERLSAEARAFGFDATPPLDLPDPAQSYFPPVSSFSRNLPTLAFSAIGQENVAATPLEMAMVGGAIANKGVIMTPHVLDRVTNSQDKVVATYGDKPWRRATSASTAAKMTTLMESVVNSPDGTGVAAAIPGVEVAGKTGTAQTQVNGVDKTDDWFVAFAPAKHPTIAVAVLLPDQGAADQYQGGTLAAPLAKAMIEADLAMGGGSKAAGASSGSKASGGTTPATTPATTPSTSPATSPAAAPATVPVTSVAPATTAPAATTPTTVAAPTGGAP